MGQEEVDEVAKVIAAKQLFRVGDPATGHLQEVERFEHEWAEKIGTEYSLLMCGGGTSALVCALAGLGLGPGDEVIVPGYTWLASATSVLTVGAIPVLAEVDDSLCLDPEDVERKIGPNTKAIMPVHMSGRPCNLEALLAVARKHGLKLIEDSCQMVGGSYKGRRTGSWGDVGAFSFNYFKIISTGEGGAVVTNDRVTYERAFVYHDSGSLFRPMASDLTIPVFVAQQYRADEIMGAIARIQMQRLDGIISDLRRNRKLLESQLADSTDFRIAPNNDTEGDCGVCVLLQFDTATRARAFVQAGAPGALAIDSGKHVYINWEPLIEKRIMHHPEMNPFNFPSNQGLRMEYGPGTCPKTLDILNRTFTMAIDPDWTQEQIAGVARTVKETAAKI
jgi:dTDP-4-amino-4,6-dideoxygalactose transaminase